MADQGLTNSQMTNAREIIYRLDPAKFHVTTFCLDEADPRIRARPNTRLIQLPRQRQTIRLLREYIFGKHEILFYMKSAPASRLYTRLREKWKDGRITIGTVESQSDLRNEPTVNSATVAMWEKTILRCDFLFSNSQAVKRSLQSEYGLFSEVIETGVDAKFFVPRSEKKVNARTRVLFVGSLRPFKQPHLLLEAAARFPSADFVIAGGGTMAAELQLKILKQNLTNMSLMGPLTASGLREQYQAANIFLFPSQWEGSPKVILEAAACGVPVVARKNYSPETLIDGVTGYLVTSDDDLYMKLEKLLADKDLRERLGAAARIHSERFDWDIITLKWESTFMRLVSQRKASR